MCGFDRGDFGKARRNFEEHITEHHDPWTYIFYILYMKEKGETELSGMEYHCWRNVQVGSTDFIPIGNTQFLNMEPDDEEDIKAEVQMLNEKADDLTKYIKANFAAFWQMIESKKVIDLPKRPHTIAKEEDDEEEEE